MAGEDAVPEKAVTPAASEMTTRITPEDFNATISELHGGVANLALERALAEIDGLQMRLRESKDLELLPVAQSLGRLCALLVAGGTGAREAGELLKKLGGQAQHLADSTITPAAISKRLKTLAGCSPAREIRSRASPSKT